jgi:mannose-1-phosphate guanylyltransferase
MVPVNGRPFLEYLVRMLEQAGLRDVILLTGRLAEQIEEYFGDGSAFGLEIRYSREEVLLGTGGALKFAEPLLADRFFLLNGDTYLPTDGEAMDAELDRTGAIALVSAYPNHDHLAPKNNLTVGEDGRVLAYDKVGTPIGGNAVDAGVSLFRSDLLALLPPGASSLEETVYPHLIGTGQLRAWRTNERFYDMGTPERLEIIGRVLS